MCRLGTVQLLESLSGVELCRSSYSVYLGRASYNMCIFDLQ